MSALIDTERPQYYETLVDAGFTEKQARMQILVMQDLARLYDDASRNTLPSKGDVQDVQLEIEKIRADMTVQLEKVRADVGKNQVEVEKVRGEVEKVRAEVEKVRAEVEKVRAEVVKVRAELKVDIEKVRSEVEKVRAELKVDMKALEVRLLRWQIGIGVALVAVMAKGFHWLGF